MIFVVPSRGRPHNIVALIDAWQQTRTFAQLFVVVDDDDLELTNYHRILVDSPDWVQWIRFSGRGMNAALNEYAVALAQTGKFETIGFMGDDHRPMTAGWDVRFRDALRLPGGGIVYGNDLIQGANLPTHVVMSAWIIRELEHMAPKQLTHLYLDNYWRALGEGIGRLFYLGDVIVRHDHPLAGRAPWDEGYERVNHGEVYAHDGGVYQRYVENGSLDMDIARVGSRLLEWTSES